MQIAAGHVYRCTAQAGPALLHYYIYLQAVLADPSKDVGAKKMRRLQSLLESSELFTHLPGEISCVGLILNKWEQVVVDAHCRVEELLNISESLNILEELMPGKSCPVCGAQLLRGTLFDFVQAQNLQGHLLITKKLPTPVVQQNLLEYFELSERQGVIAEGVLYRRSQPENWPASELTIEADVVDSFVLPVAHSALTFDNSTAYLFTGRSSTCKFLGAADNHLWCPNVSADNHQDRHAIALLSQLKSASPVTRSVKFHALLDQINQSLVDTNKIDKIKIEMLANLQSLVLDLCTLGLGDLTVAEKVSALSLKQSLLLRLALAFNIKLSNFMLIIPELGMFSSEESKNLIGWLEARCASSQISACLALEQPINLGAVSAAEQTSSEPVKAKQQDLSNRKKFLIKSDNPSLKIVCGIAQVIATDSFYGNSHLADQIRQDLLNRNETDPKLPWQSTVSISLDRELRQSATLGNESGLTNSIAHMLALSASARVHGVSESELVRHLRGTDWCQTTLSNLRLGNYRLDELQSTKIDQLGSDLEEYPVVGELLGCLSSAGMGNLFLSDPVDILDADSWVSVQLINCVAQALGAGGEKWIKSTLLLWQDQLPYRNSWQAKMLIELLDRLGELECTCLVFSDCLSFADVFPTVSARYGYYDNRLLTQ